MLAYQESVSTAEIEMRIRDGNVDLPETIKNLLERQGLQVTPPPVTTFSNTIQRWQDRLLKRSQPRDAQLDQQVEAIIQFIEQQLELTYARS